VLIAGTPSRRLGYGLRGWRRGNLYPDFLFAALRDTNGRDRRVVIETKGEQLEGNRDTEYKRALLETLSAAFREATAKQG
jgi:type III restriction enzyme